MSKDSPDDHDHPDLSKVVEKVNEHVETRLQYLRLLISEKVALATAKMASLGILLGLFMLFFFFVNVAVAMWIGKHFDNYPMGFAVVSAFYLLLIIFYAVLRKSVFEKKIEDSVIQSLFAEHDDEEDDDEA